MSNFKPWKIRHVDLSQETPWLSSETGIGGIYVVFWHRNIPLGHRWIPAKELPVSPSGLTQLALTAIAPAVGDYLLGHPVEVSPSTGDHQGFDVDFGALAEIKQPLMILQKRFARTRGDSEGCSTSVVVCTKDRPRQLQRCLWSFRSLFRKPHEIVVVDNAFHPKAERSVVDRFPEVRYIHEPRPGLNVARNAGIRNTDGELVAFVDDDVTVHPNWIAGIQHGFEDPSVKAVTGLVLPAELKTEAQFLFETHWGFGRGYQNKVFGSQFFGRYRSHGVPVWEMGAGANMAFRRQAFDEVGRFDERLDAGAAGCSGDSEMWYRILARKGICHYVPTAVAYHYHRREMETFHRQLFFYMRGHVAALLIQFERHGHWGNIRRILLSLPRYYVGLMVHGLLYGFVGRRSTLKREILGCLSGLKFYLHNRA
ncbi:MAG: glycosyltransferase family 2 protein [Desulfobacteraceae bacterium]